MNPFGVSERRVEQLRAQMERLGLREVDLDERFIRAGGPGGQNVNKVATCVWLRHRPTGLEVKVQRERTQGMNRFLARRLLVERLNEMRERRLAAEQARLYRIRRQRRRRPLHVKEQILKRKRRHSLKKRLRARPSPDD